MTAPRANKRVTVLGSTGSVGRQTLDVIDRYPDRFRVEALVANRNVDLLFQQISRFHPRAVALGDASLLPALLERLDATKTPRPEILTGEDGAVQVARADTDVVMAAMVGAAGLPPTLAAVEAGRKVALANKEVLVMAGELVTRTAAKTGAQLLPVDSEHCALHQAICCREKDVERLVLTASGGPFLELPDSEFDAITPERALKHPRWDMGAKISIDSSTLLNKGFEVLEAAWLFGVPVSKIGIVVHPEAIVHSLVEFVDGSTIAQLGIPDMAVPIAYALSWPARLPGVVKHADLAKIGALHFREPDRARFPAIDLAYQAAKAAGTAPAMLVAADDVAVEAFLQKRIPYREICAVLAGVLDAEPVRKLDSLADVQEAASIARSTAGRLVDGGLRRTARA